MNEYYDWAKPIVKWISRLLSIISFLAIISLILEYGFYLNTFWSQIIRHFNLIVIFFYFLQYIAKLCFSQKKIEFLKFHWFEALIAILIFFELLLLLGTIGLNLFQNYFINFNNKITMLYIIIAQILIILSVIPGIVQYNQSISKLKFHPAVIVIFSFAFAIIIGTLLLLLPKAVRLPNKISFIDALFTITSATCVTGLTVVDTAAFFSPIGQFIILFFIQIGGIGIITLTSFLTLFFGRGIGIKERVFLSDIMSSENISLILTTLRNIIILVFSIELIGAIFLFFIWSGLGFPLHKLIFFSVFHSISAFCNAGFSTFSNNLMDFKSNIGVVLVITSLIIIGGLGFNVLMDLGFSNILSKEKKKKISLKVQTKLVIIVTIILILVGVISYILLEKPFKTYDIPTSILNAYFTSVTARTAGYNTIDMASLSVPMCLVMIMLMFIGASPGSTGGGIKTTTVAILWKSIMAILSRNRRVIIFKKDVPFVVLNRSLVVFFFSIILICFAAFILTITDKFNFIDIFFEVVSAFGTVGLSRGITPALSISGKSIIIALMFIGRIGILTLAYAVTRQKEQQVKVEYPQEIVVVG